MTLPFGKLVYITMQTWMRDCNDRPVLRVQHESNPALYRHAPGDVILPWQDRDAEVYDWLAERRMRFLFFLLNDHDIMARVQYPFGLWVCYRFAEAKDAVAFKLTWS
jgi:hypothetical protein